MNREPFYSGKVRDLYEVDDSSMIISATDRISAFDVVFNQEVPGKGIILNQVSSLWFQALRNSGLQQKLDFSDHIIEIDQEKFPAPFNQMTFLKDRAVYVRRSERINFECVVRGYLAGSGFKDYQKTGQVCGHELPAGLKLAEQLPEPIFTPATKAEQGHDENVTFDFMKETLRKTYAQTPELYNLPERLAEISIAIYNFAHEKLKRHGIILCDTKFEFGLINNQLLLIDELLTPDSSRYWDKETYKPGENPPGFDKQHIRDFAEQSGWNKLPPAPDLPETVITRTQELYREIQRRVSLSIAADN